MVGSNEAGVARVMSLGISSRWYPTARRAAILAMGNPVALEARADERETRGFISMMTRRPVSRIDGELHVGPAGLHADPAQAGEGVVAHGLVLDVGQRLGRRHRDGVAGVHPHGIEVLDGADHHAVVRGVAHDLELVLLPAGDGTLDQDLAHRAGGQALDRQLREVRRVLGDAGARTRRE